MKKPSGFQVAVLMVCGSLMAGVSCFHTADNTSSVLGTLGYAAGLGVLGYAALALAQSKPASPSSPPLETLTPPQRGPTVAQGLALALCGFLLFFFSCGGALIPVRGGYGPFVTLGFIGMAVGGGFAVWGFVTAVIRMFSGSK